MTAKEVWVNLKNCDVEILGSYKMTENEVKICKEAVYLRSEFDLLEAVTDKIDKKIDAIIEGHKDFTKEEISFLVSLSECFKSSSEEK